MRVLFMGTSDFAIPALEHILAHNFEIIGVVTQPDRPSGRGKKLCPPPVKKLAYANNLCLYQPEKVREPEFVETLKQLKPDVIVVAAFGQILPKSVLNIPDCGVINLHPSLLPKYRGAAPIQWALINGEKETGITLMLLDEGEDTGDIICTKRVPIKIHDTGETLHNTLATLGARLLIEVLINLKTGQQPNATPQNHNEATHAPRLTKKLGNVKWSDDAFTIHNLIRGTLGWPGAYTYFREGMLLKIIQSQLPDFNRAKSDYPRNESPGTIFINKEHEMIVITGKGEIQLTRVQPATKRIMDVRDFVNGYQITSGESFSSI